MWQDKLKEIIYILENSNMNEIEVTFWGKKYKVVKSPGNLLNSMPGTNVIQSTTQNEVISSQEEKPVLQKEEVQGEDLLSPMPGTYYSAPTPDDPPFVSIGSKVSKGQTLCIIEAMKIMNEIESEFDGIITAINVKNSDPVEYNQVLFKISPS
ncbi:MAG: acetyl-CoA carboxylase biotin carboxyl carrier protein [Fidelibacterota bacterium]|jgi:acetyl-CoA carboxylase biotin carboxyl carrier protein|tara:strand:- start:339 stop:797 length:459 start_codon:yes stop_codon:yes gene_type:complete